MIFRFFEAQPKHVFNNEATAHTPKHTHTHTHLMVGAYILGSTLRSWKSNMSTIDESPVFEMPPAKKPTVRLSC